MMTVHDLIELLKTIPQSAWVMLPDTEYQRNVRKDSDVYMEIFDWNGMHSAKYNKDNDVVYLMDNDTAARQKEQEQQ